MTTSSFVVRHHILLSDPLGRWGAPLKAALLPHACEWVSWPELTVPALPVDELGFWAATQLRHNGQSLSLAIWHCHPHNLRFAQAWLAAVRFSNLPPLIALLDQPDREATELLREIGCAEVHAGFHSWDRLVKTVTSLLASPVISDHSLENQIAACLPWAPKLDPAQQT